MARPTSGRSTPPPAGLLGGSAAGSSKQRGLLARLAEARQAEGRYVLTSTDLGAVPLTRSALVASLRRLTAAGRLAKIGYRRGIWLIVPPEYRSLGSPPSTWVLHDIMEAFGTPYYVALRSAAEWYGATHHAMQVLHVAVGQQLKPMKIGRQRLRFVVRTGLAAVPTRMIPGQVAPLRCSTPAATAMDLVRYMSVAGGLSAVAGVLHQMHEQLERTDLIQTLDALGDTANAQRLGYLLTRLGNRRAAEICQRWIHGRATRVVALEHGPRAAPRADAPVDPTWKIAVNAEPDLSL